MEKRRKSAALLPVGVFLVFYLGLGILFEILYLIFDYPYKHYTFKYFEV